MPLTERRAGDDFDENLGSISAFPLEGKDYGLT
jgi:hypothetical protein